MEDAKQGWAGLCKCGSVRAATMGNSADEEDAVCMDIGRMVIKGLTVERRGLPIQIESCKCKFNVLKNSMFRPIAFWDWRKLNTEQCDVCCGTGRKPSYSSSVDKHCPSCFARYEAALTRDKEKWKTHAEFPAFFVTANAASKTARSYLEVAGND